MAFGVERSAMTWMTEVGAKGEQRRADGAAASAGPTPPTAPGVARRGHPVHIWVCSGGPARRSRKQIKFSCVFNIPKRAETQNVEKHYVLDASVSQNLVKAMLK